jgi:hypothetical protein
LYASALIAIWQRILSLNISWDFDLLGKVLRKRGMFIVVVPSACDRRVAITSSAEVGTASLYRLLGFGIEDEQWDVTDLEVREEV